MESTHGSEAPGPDVDFDRDACCASSADTAGARGRGAASAEEVRAASAAEEESMLHLLLNLPQALTTTILKRLDLQSIGQLSCASRACCEATSDPEVLSLKVHGTARMPNP